MLGDDVSSKQEDRFHCCSPMVGLAKARPNQSIIYIHLFCVLHMNKCSWTVCKLLHIVYKGLQLDKNILKGGWHGKVYSEFIA